jgi:predicted nucleotidyltransferase
MSRVHRLGPEARESITKMLAAELAGHPEVSFAYLHGSFLHAEGFRDVDVAIWTSPDAERFADVDLAVRLSRLTALPVDVRRLNVAPLAFVFHAIRGRPLVVHDERLLADVIERTARQYHDQAPLALQAAREAFR